MFRPKIFDGLRHVLELRYYSGVYINVGVKENTMVQDGRECASAGDGRGVIGDTVAGTYYECLPSLNNLKTC